MNTPFNVKIARKQIKIWTNIAKDLKTLRLWTWCVFLVLLTLGERCSRWNIYWDGTTHQVSSHEEWSWVSREAQQSLILPCLNNGRISDPSQTLHLTWQSSSPWDCGTTYPKINCFACLWSFILRTVTLWIKVGIVDVKDDFHLTTWNLWSSVTVPEAELSLRVPQNCKHGHITLNLMDEYLHWAHHSSLHAQGM